MQLDFSKLRPENATHGIVDPRKLFTTLQRVARFRRPSDEQGEVLDLWFANRNQRDHTIKMNTGAGKTLVGLLLLQSSLNEGVGPAVYVTPDNYLSSQVLLEAKDLGIPVTEDERSHEFSSHKAIAVVTIRKLFNGMSTFGVGSTKIKVGAFVVDDAHACIATVGSQFTVHVERSHPIYKQMFDWFGDDLAQQSSAGMIQISDGDPRAHMAVPFWSWKNRSQQVTQLLTKHRQDEELRFTVPLLLDHLPLCQCFFGGDAIEIAPRCIPVSVVPSFQNAARRIYMTATLADDGALVTHFGAALESVEHPIRPKGVGSMGDRMILVPQQINPKAQEEELRDLVATVAKHHNVSVIVPSKRRAEFWRKASDQILDAQNIHEGVSLLKSGRQVGMTILLNKYDGVDLPDDACRVLVVDGLPEVYSLAERADFAALDGTELQLIRQIQRIEQGMGRGVRSSEDYCVVLLAGRRLTERIASPAGRKRFTPATRAQLMLSDQVAAQVQGKPLSELRGVMDYCLTRNTDWVNASRSALAEAPDGPESCVDPWVTHVRKAFDFGSLGLWPKAREAMQAAVNSALDPLTKGYFLQQLAEYVFHSNPSEAQEILLSAIQLNPRVTRPIAGISYARLSPPVLDQAVAAVAYMKRFESGNEMLIWISGVIEDLVWSDEEESELFEKAVKDLGDFLGFGSQRPESETGSGPDNLWSVGELRYLVIECKSGSKSPIVGKRDWNQLNGSALWFQKHYDKTCDFTPIMIHPSNRYDKQASLAENTRVIESEKLTELKNQLRKYAAAASEPANRQNPSGIAKLLKTHALNGGSFAYMNSKLPRLAN